MLLPNTCMKLASRLAALTGVMAERYRNLIGASAARAPACSVCTTR
jgi:hypothetical protein